MYSKIRFVHPLEWRLKLNNKLYNNYPLLEIKDFGPLTIYGEDKELKLNEKITPLPIPPPRGGRIVMKRKTRMIKWLDWGFAQPLVVFVILSGAKYLKHSVLYVRH